jgi:hypothetical protein
VYEVSVSIACSSYIEVTYRISSKVVQDFLWIPTDELRTCLKDFEDKCSARPSSTVRDVRLKKTVEPMARGIRLEVVVMLNLLKVLAHFFATAQLVSKNTLQCTLIIVTDLHNPSPTPLSKISQSLSLGRNVAAALIIALVFVSIGSYIVLRVLAFLLKSHP